MNAPMGSVDMLVICFNVQSLTSCPVNISLYLNRGTLHFNAGNNTMMRWLRYV